MPVRILIVNANTMQSITAGIEAEGRASAGSDVLVTAVTPEMGPQTVESYYDAALAVPGILRAVAERRADYDAFVIGGWGDPGIEAAREVVSQPVVGIGEASMYVCNMLAARWAVLTVLPRVHDFVTRTVRKTGFQVGPAERCVGVFTTELTVADTAQSPVATSAALAAAGRTALSMGAEAVVLGCAGMVGLDEDLERSLGVPVVSSVAAGVQLAVGLVHLAKKTSKIGTYRPVLPIEFKDYDALL